MKVCNCNRIAAPSGVEPPTEEFADCTAAVGNSSLAGAAKYLRNEDGEAVLRDLVEKSEEIALSSDKEFNEFYMDSMFFEAE